MAPALAVAELSILLGPAPIRVAAGLTLGLILPGLAFTRVLGRGRIRGAERLLLVAGISVVIAILTGLVLNGAHIPLTTENWAIALGLVTVVGLAIEATSASDERPGRDPRRNSRRPPDPASVGGRRMPGVVSVAMVAVAAIGAVGALVVSALGERYRGPGFTELWALPSRSSLSAVRLGVLSHERHDVRYRLRVSIDDRDVRTQQITLRPGQAWQSTQPGTQPGEHVDVLLENWPRGTVYRQVHLSTASSVVSNAPPLRTTSGDR
jgi:uncharacterized membrane protein